MNYTLDLQPAQCATENSIFTQTSQEHTLAQNAFHTSFLTTQARTSKTVAEEKTAEISTVMKSAEFLCLVNAARQFADLEGISIEEATERLIVAFRRLDSAWNAIVLQKGLETLTQNQTGQN